MNYYFFFKKNILNLKNYLKKQIILIEIYMYNIKKRGIYFIVISKTRS